MPRVPPHQGHRLRQSAVWLVLCLVLLSSFAQPIPPAPVAIAQAPVAQQPFG